MMTTLSVASLHQGKIESARRAARFHGEAAWEAKLAADSAARRQMSFLDRFNRAFTSAAAFYVLR